MKPHTLYINGRKTVDQFIEALALMNTASHDVTLIGYGGNVSRCVEVAQMICEEVGGAHHATQLSAGKVLGNSLPKIETTVSLNTETSLDKGQKSDLSISSDFGPKGFINYSTYHLMVEDILERDELEFYVSPTHSSLKKGSEPLLLFSLKKKDGLHYLTIPKGINKANESDAYSNLSSALNRAGNLPPKNWKNIAKQLSKHDDIILGLDTNILINTYITSHLLPSVALIEPKKYVHTPNWILLAVPGAAMFELEVGANERNGAYLNHIGSRNFRALQEILTLSENVDIPGVSLFISGDTDPVLDVKTELKHISKGLEKLGRGQGSPLKEYKAYKTSSGDMTIRSQFKHFLRDISFHKGAYFLTSDKTNAALALAEGIRPIYVAPPENLKSGRTICLEDRVPIQAFSLGKLMYELAVSFGGFEIKPKNGGPSFTLEADKKGESLHNWLHKKLRITRKDLSAVLQGYQGRFDLKKVVTLYQQLTSDFETVDWLNGSSNAFDDEDDVE